jgi:D-glycero-alpha-D-manno-heptose-7-phosphate kinase
MSFYITRTPFRVSFFGGGTDYPEWYRENGGAVLSTTIDKYCYISCRYFPPFFDVRHRIVWSHIENVHSIDEILHPAVREGLRFLGFNDTRGLEIHYQADLPARAGIGSSSAFAVGLIAALKALRNEPIERMELARAAIELERERLKEAVGSQDQMAVACGGFNLIRFHPDGNIEYTPVNAPNERIADLESRLLLIFTGTSRIASRIASEMIAGLNERTADLHAMRALVDEALDIVEQGRDLDEFGRLLDATWKLKRGLSASISTEAIDQIYETAMKHGALGGKLLGAGGTGFMLFYVPPERRAEVAKALGNYLTVPFRFENAGSTLVYRPGDTTAEGAARG